MTYLWIVNADMGETESSRYLCNSSKTYVINNRTEHIPLEKTRWSFAPAFAMAELMLTNVMMLSVLIAIFT